MQDITFPNPTVAARSILADIRRDMVDYPALRTATSFSDLHDIVDANEYLIDLQARYSLPDPDFSDPRDPVVAFEQDVLAVVDIMLALGYAGNAFKER